jgi:hypothetical protein
MKAWCVCSNDWSINPFSYKDLKFDRKIFASKNESLVHLNPAMSNFANLTPLMKLSCKKGRLV